MIAYILLFCIGAIVGSFLNVCIYRLPRNVSIVFPSSRCPSCDSNIKFYDNIPIISYLVLRGKCRQCRTVISPMYPVVEFLNAVLYVLIYDQFIAFSLWVVAIYCVFVSVLVVITFIDTEHMIIPNRITIPGIPLALLVGALILPDPFSRLNHLGILGSFVGCVSGGVGFYLVALLGETVFRKPALGGGDIKLMAMIGALLGWKGVILTTFAGSLIGSLAGFMLIMAKGKTWGSRLPFGPFLAAGAVISLFWGQDVLTWYLYAG